MASASDLEALRADDILVAKDTSTRGKVAEFCNLRAAGFNNTEIAAHLHVTRQRLNAMIRQAVKEGWLVFDDPEARFEHEIAPKVAANVVYWLDAKDKQMTIEAAKGLGLFKSHQSVKVDGGPPTNVLAIKFEALPPSAGSEVMEGNIVATPKALPESGE